MTPTAWFAPAPLSDIPSLFLCPDQWPRARERTRVLQLYLQTITADWWLALEACGAFPLLKAWGIELALEVGSVKPGEVENGQIKPGHEGACDGSHNLAAVLFAIDRITIAGGTVSYLAIDEPMMSGRRALTDPEFHGCGMTLEQTAERVAWWIAGVRSFVPNIVLVENYPGQNATAKTADTLAFWHLLERMGARPNGLHVDVDRYGLRDQDVSDRRWKNDLTTLKVGIGEAAFGILAWGQRCANEAQYQADVLKWVGRVKRAGIDPHRLIVQAWDPRIGTGRKDLPYNLPDTDPLSHTGLLLEIAS